LGNGVELRVIRWNDDARYDVLGSFNTRDTTVGKCGTAEFVLRLPSGKVGTHVDFVLHHAGSHICDATALQVRVYTQVPQFPAQKDVTQPVQARFRGRLVTPLGSYEDLFGKTAADTEQTLKVQLHDWQAGTKKCLEFPQDAPLDLTGSLSD
jgi:hypothetical protein